MTSQGVEHTNIGVAVFIVSRAVQVAAFHCVPFVVVSGNFFLLLLIQWHAISSCTKKLPLVPLR